MTINIVTFKNLKIQRRFYGNLICQKFQKPSEQ